MTLALIGQCLLLLALLATAVGSIAAFVGARQIMRVDPDRPARPATDGSATGNPLVELALGAQRLVLAAASGSILLVLLALAGRDYTLSYVAGRISNDLDLGFRLTALWSGQEGSLLLWLTVLALCGVIMARSLRSARVPAALLAFAVGTMLTIATFFTLLVAVVARPFGVVDQLPRDGAGMSPALQNYWMALHPPTLYLGYVGVAVPFAIVVGALLARRRDDQWIVTTRRWIIGAWTFLTLGLVLGARWAYEEIGWGGYWAWDPVENAALMPWLTATALMHSIMVQQRRGMMRFWNALLASLTFALSIFGTFLTRSGVLSSVHSFVSSPVGWWFIGALVVLLACTMLLLHRSRELLRARHDVDAVVSREAMLLLNNLLLVALTLVVLWGVTYPIMTAAFSHTSISLEKPWYDFFAIAFGLPLTLLVAFAPVIAWQGTPIRRVLRSMLAPIGISLVVGIALIAAGLGESVLGIVAVSLGVLVILGVAHDFRGALRMRREAAPEQPMLARWQHVLRRMQRRWGAWIAHVGLAMLVIAIAGAAWTTRTTMELRTGESVRVGSYELTYVEVERSRSGARMQTRARFAVRRGERRLADLYAGRDFHPASGEISNEVGVRHDLLRLHDLFVTVDRLTEDGVVRAQAFINPLMPLLWLSGLLIAGGAVIAALQDRGGAAARPSDTNDDRRVEPDPDAVHELRNGAAAPGELLPGVRRTPLGPRP